MASKSHAVRETPTRSAGLLNLLSRILLPIGLFAIALFGAGVNAAHAAKPDKVASDLKSVLNSGATTKWAANTSLGKYVQVVVSADSSDSSLSALRAAIVAGGGSVLYQYQATPALLAIVPANKVDALVARDDVSYVVPNRAAHRTLSFEEMITGAGSLRASNPSAFTGAGVGIAVMDSGIDTCHAAFGGTMNGNSGTCKSSARIAASADFTKLSTLSLSDWTRSTDLSAGYAPGSTVYNAFQKWVDNSGTANPDVYGHGTHVASIAAGQAVAGAPDATGLAPGATLVDLRVLDENGVGSLGDVLAAIDWAVANRKTYNIRVFNLSLTTPGSGSFLTDPLCKAVRAATSLGIVVVVAAGNFGLTADGKEILGLIGAPANEPTVITVGSAHRTTRLRAETKRSTNSAPAGRPGPRQSTSTASATSTIFSSPISSHLATRSSARSPERQNPANVIAAEHPELEATGFNAGSNGRLMELSGTSIAAPAVAGTVALMLQANPGLTPGLVKAILQYTAQPLPGLIAGSARHGPPQRGRRGASCAIATFRHCLAETGGQPARARQDATVGAIDDQRRSRDLERNCHNGWGTCRRRPRAPGEVSRDL